MLSRIKGDLDLRGISMGFASVSKGLPKAPTGVDVDRSAYETPDVHIPLGHGKVLHVSGCANNREEVALVAVNAGEIGSTGAVHVGFVSRNELPDVIRSLGVRKANRPVSWGDPEFGKELSLSCV